MGYPIAQFLRSPRYTTMMHLQIAMLLATICGCCTASDLKLEGFGKADGCYKYHPRGSYPRWIRDDTTFVYDEYYKCKCIQTGCTIDKQFDADDAYTQWIIYHITPVQGATDGSVSYSKVCETSAKASKPEDPPLDPADWQF